MTSKAKQLASITAVGASAIALTAGKAKADGIIVSAMLNTTVGFTGNAQASTNRTANSHIFNTFASGPRFGFKAVSNNGGGTYSLRNLAFADGKSTEFALLHGTGGRVIGNFPSGATWATAATRAFTSPLVGERQFSSGAGNTEGLPPFMDGYFLFSFRQGGVTDFGWIEASLMMRATTSTAPNGPDVTVVQYAFDTTGAHIAAGEIAASPEPASIAESMLGALILGAEGLRRWRKARKHGVRTEA